MPIKLNWFKMLWLNSDERKALLEAKRKEECDTEPVAQGVQEEKTDPKEPPYVNILYAISTKTVTVIFWGGEILTKQGVERELFEKVKAAKTEEDIKLLLIDPVKEVLTYEQAEEKRDQVVIKDNLFAFRGRDDFKIEDDKVYLKPVELPLPPVVAATFIEIIERIYQAMHVTKSNRSIVEELEASLESLKCFWLQLCTNPLEQSRKDVLTFVKKNDVRLTRRGNMVLYRRIVSEGTEDKRLVTFISQEYFKVKKWKKSPNTFSILEKGDVRKMMKENNVKKAIGEGYKLVGKLGDLYGKLDQLSGNTFTSSHNRGVMKIKIGGIYRIPENQINLDNGICAAGGLHAASVNYNYDGFGDTAVVVLVSPSKAITVPTGDTGKLRTTEMFVACVNDKPRGTHFEEGGLSVFDDEYYNLTINELEEVIKSKSILAIKDVVSPLSFDNIEAIKNALKDRIKPIV